MSKLRVILLSILFSNIMYSQTTNLVAGDIAFVQLNPELGLNLETIEFVALTSLDIGTVIYFTTRGWNNTTGAFNATVTEGTHTYTVSGTAVSCGDVVSITLGGGIDSDFNSAGDSLLAYQGTVGAPTFLFGAHWSSNIAWDMTAADNANNSELPDGVNGGTALTAASSFAIEQKSNGNKSNRLINHQYDNTGTLTGAKATILSNVANTANWVTHPLATDNGGAYADFTPTAFTSTVAFTGTTWGAAGDYFTSTISATYDTSLRGDFNTCTCIVDSGIIVTVNSGGTVTIEENITNNGTIVVDDGGSVIQKIAGTNTGTGTYTVERITTSLSTAYQYTLWSSPVASTTMADVVSDADRYLSFDASIQDYNFLTSASSMTPGVGYFIQASNGGTYPGTNTATFTGTSAFNNGDVAVTLGFNAGGTEDDWNMVGNPYPSAIFADDFLNENSTTIGGTIYLWSHNTNTTSAGNHTDTDYASYNVVGGVGTAASSGGGHVPSGYIASGQGFWVEATVAGSVTFTNNVRSGGSNNTDFFKTRKKSLVERDRIWLNLTSDKDYSEILIGFLKEATDGVDRAYDGKYLNGGGNISFYSVLEDTPYVIQGLSALKEKQVIPLGFSNTKVGSFKIAIRKKEGKLTAAKIVLEDKFLNIEHRLDISDYEFNSEEIGDFKERFVLTVNSEKDSDDSGVLELNTYVRDNNLHIDYLNDTDKIKRVSIYSITGSVFYDSKIKAYEGVIPVNNLKSKGIYILRIQLNSGAIITKKL